MIHLHAPDPLKNHGYTDICSCGLRLHRDDNYFWVPDDGELELALGYAVRKGEKYLQRIAGLEAELADLNSHFDHQMEAERLLEKAEAALATARRDFNALADADNATITKLQQAEATIERLKTALVAIQSTTPGSAHRIAIQALHTPMCPDVDEYECENCKGHNRCEDEMNAGFGEYEAPDVDR